jgi:hypothetical protein
VKLTVHTKVDSIFTNWPLINKIITNLRGGDNWCCRYMIKNSFYRSIAHLHRVNNKKRNSRCSRPPKPWRPAVLVITFMHSHQQKVMASTIISTKCVTRSRIMCDLWSFSGAGTCDPHALPHSSTFVTPMQRSLASPSITRIRPETKPSTASQHIRKLVVGL